MNAEQRALKLSVTHVMNAEQRALKLSTSRDTCTLGLPRNVTIDKIVTK